MASKRKRSQHDTDDEEGETAAACSSEKRMKKYEQVFLSSYCKDFPFISRSTKGHTKAFCKICKSDFNIDRSGAYDIKRHAEGKFHKRNASASGSASILSHFKNNSEERAEGGMKEKVMRAECLFCHLVAEQNLSLSTMTRLTEMVKIAFPDSKIAAGFQCGRSKATAVVKKMAENFQVSLTDRMNPDQKDRMKTGPYSISTDGSNDAEDKQFPIVVRSLNRNSGLVQSELLAVPVCQDSGTGENIFGLIQEELTGRLIPWEHCLSLGCDNVPVMTGRYKGVYAFVKEQQPQIYLSGCTLHIVHNAGKKAAAELPPVDTVLVVLFYYFNKSASRQQRFKGTQKLYGDEVKKMLKHVSTRWLSIGRCLERLLTNWDTLKIFFKEEVDQLKKAKTTSAYASSKADSIFQFVRSPTNQLYVNFMLFVVKSLEPFLLTFQDEKPQIHKLRRSIQRLYKQIMVKFLKPSSLPVGVCLEDVDYKSSDNQRDDDDIAIGDAARSMIENKEAHHLRESRIKEFFSHVRGYYTTLLEYLMSRLPATHSPITSNGEGNTPFLSLVEVADVDLQAEVKFTSLRQLLIRFPVLMPSGCNMDKIGEQFSLYQCSDVNKHKTDRLDATWANIGGDTSLEMEELSLVMRGILVIPHSSAHCERIFSCVRKNKTSERSSLSSQTLESLLVLKNTKSKDIQNMSLDTLRQLKSAYADSLKDDADTD